MTFKKKTATTKAAPSEDKVPAAKAPEKTPVQPEPLKAITPEEQAIAARVLGDSFDLSTGEDSIVDYAFYGRDMMELPPPAKKMRDEKKYSFRWVERKPARMDQVKNKPRPFRWWLCNSTNTPFLKKYLDPVLGGVIREDCILMFKPWEDYEAEKAYKRSLADALDQSGNMLSKHGEVVTDTGVGFLAGKRSIESGATMGHEIKGADIIMADDVDPGGGSEGFGDMIAAD